MDSSSPKLPPLASMNQPFTPMYRKTGENPETPFEPLQLNDLQSPENELSKKKDPALQFSFQPKSNASIPELRQTLKNAIRILDNYQKNASYTDGQDQSGVSAYATVNLSKKVGVFGRWDYLTSKNKWNEENDGMAGLVGAEFRLGKYIKLSPNFRIWSPKAGSMPNSYYAYLNASFSL